MTYWSPAVVVVGEVVRLRARLDWYHPDPVGRHLRTGPAGTDDGDRNALHEVAVIDAGDHGARK